MTGLKPFFLSSTTSSTELSLLPSKFLLGILNPRSQKTVKLMVVCLSFWISLNPLSIGKCGRKHYFKQSQAHTITATLRRACKHPTTCTLPPKARESFNSSTAEGNIKGQKEALVLEEDYLETTLWQDNSACTELKYLKVNGSVNEPCSPLYSTHCLRWTCMPGAHPSGASSDTVLRKSVPTYKGITSHTNEQRSLFYAIIKLYAMPFNNLVYSQQTPSCEGIYFICNIWNKPCYLKQVT